MTLNDQSRMPFGKHKGKAMEDVPADYLLWLWDETDMHNREKQYTEDGFAVHDYIKENFASLETECKDRIVSHRPK